MNKLNLLIIILVFALVGVANGQKDKKVAVFDPVGDVSQNLKIVIREELSNAIVNTLGFTVLERELINKVLAENSFQMTGHVDDGQIGELGKKMGANYVCYASISSVGGNYYISCKMVDVMTAKIERQNTGITQSGLDDLFTVVSTVSRAMLQQQVASVRNRSTSSNQTKYVIDESDSKDLIELNMMGLSILVMPIDATPTKTTWMEANNACLESNSYGLSEWRLPTKLEISRMFAQKSALRKMESYWYWSGTPEKNNVYFRQAFDADKLVPAAAKAKSFARCVHSNGAINLADADGVWEYSLYGTDYQVMPEDVEGIYKWVEARNTCESSSAYGYNDWELPSIESLGFMYNNKIALNMGGEWYWSSTPKKSGSTSAMFEKNFFDGQTYDTGSNAKRQVRCIRKKN
ncbi:MAG: DUF1566 domain-containing protein [Bacteroidales bacterium]|nr:DUF1566 domain-containing protein [Bacteroidales bacterium]